MKDIKRQEFIYIYIKPSRTFPAGKNYLILHPYSSILQHWLLFPLKLPTVF